MSDSDIVRMIRADLVLSSDDDVAAAVNHLLLSYDALTSERDALAAENARLREASDILMPMAELWAEGGGRLGPEMQDVERARALVATPSAVQSDLLGDCLNSMQRVWSKVQESERADYKQYVEMGDILFHATNGQKGACGGYTGPPCEES